MSEMLANQYFISGRYFEAFEEYSKLPPESKNNLLIKKRMIVCAALDEKFEKALSLLKDLEINDFGFFNGLNISDEECSYKELVKILENQDEQQPKYQDMIKMKIAIINIFSSPDKSLEYFKEIKNANYTKIVNAFLKSFNYKKHNYKNI